MDKIEMQARAQALADMTGMIVDLVSSDSWKVVHQSHPSAKVNRDQSSVAGPSIMFSELPDHRGNPVPAQRPTPPPFALLNLRSTVAGLAQRIAQNDRILGQKEVEVHKGVMALRTQRKTLAELESYLDEVHPGWRTLPPPDETYATEWEKL